MVKYQKYIDASVPEKIQAYCYFKKFMYVCSPDLERKNHKKTY